MGYQRQKFNQIAVRRWRKYDPDIEKRDIEGLNPKKLRHCAGSNYRDQPDFRRELRAKHADDTEPLARDDTEGSDV